jgi:hypothetical protein
MDALSFCEVLGGVMVSMLAIGRKVHGFKYGRRRWIFKCDENPQHAFLLRGSKTVSSMSKILQHIKDPLEV